VIKDHNYCKGIQLLTTWDFYKQCIYILKIDSNNFKSRLVFYTELHKFVEYILLATLIL